jgi:hypothetical protein
VHQDILSGDGRPRITGLLTFEPNCIAASHGLLAAGGQGADIFLGYDPTHPSTPDSPPAACHTRLQRASINNALLITSSFSSSAEPSLIVSNNDCTIKHFDISTRAHTLGLELSGELRFNTPINHASVSPDGRTLLSVGDTNQVFLHNVSGGNTVTFQSIATYNTGVDANFSTAFSPSGMKFAVACQDGSVTVWDVRSSIPLARYRTSPLAPASSCMEKGKGAFLWDEPAASCPYPSSPLSPRTAGPVAARVLKFSPQGADRELLVFTAHTNNLHVIDARTFTDHQIIPVPPPEPNQSQNVQKSPTSNSPQRSFSMREPWMNGRPTTPSHSTSTYSGSLTDNDCTPLPFGYGPLPAYQGLTQRWEQSIDPSPWKQSAQDLSGVCFDPSGGWLYVGSDKAIVEYPVRPGWDFDSGQTWSWM